MENGYLGKGGGIRGGTIRGGGGLRNIGEVRCEGGGIVGGGMGMCWPGGGIHPGGGKGIFPLSR